MTKKKSRCVHRNSPEDVAVQQEIRARANYSMVLLGQSFVRHGSGRFLWLGPPPQKKG